MTNLIIICSFVMLGGFGVADAQIAKPRALDPSMNKLLTVKWISNHDPGFGGSNDFYQLSKEFLKSHDSSNFKRMANQRNPIVRAMGLLCFAQLDRDQNFLVLLSHWTDPEEVSLHEGCFVTRITVGEFVQQLFVNPRFLDK
jgi:hypothetical protein